MKTVGYASLLFISSQIFGEGDETFLQQEVQENQLISIATPSAQRTLVANAPTSSKKQKASKRTTITPSARGCPKNRSGGFVFGDALYWYARQDGLKLGSEATSVFGPGTDMHAGSFIVKDLNFKWDWGFRLGLGYNLPYDGWDLYADWTRFHTHASRTFNGIGIYLFQLFGLNVLPTEASSHWKFDFDTIDVFLGRALFLSRRFSMEPYAGLKTAWIHQKVTLQTPFNPMNDESAPTLMTRKNNFWGIGPAFGTGARWVLGCNIGIFADIDIAFLSGWLHAPTHYISPDGPHPFKLNENVLRTMSSMTLGLDWGHCFNGRYNLSFRAGYESQYWWNQFNNSNLLGDLQPDYDLTLKGLSLRGRFDF